MEQEFSNVVEPPKKNNTVLIVAAVVVALLCCCCVLAAGAFAFLGPTVGNTFETIEQGINEEYPYEEEFPYEEETPYSGEGEEDYSDDYPESLSDFVPTGGLGDETLRTDTWFNLNFAAAVNGCVIPSDGAENTSIEVLEDPDTDGVWKERWTVPCEDGSEKAFAITFTPAASGGTDFSIESE